MGRHRDDQTFEPNPNRRTVQSIVLEHQRDMRVRLPQQLRRRAAEARVSTVPPILARA